MPRKPRKQRDDDPETVAFLFALGQKIQQLRTEDYSQEDFAAAVDVYRSHMSLIERGKTDVRLSTLLRIARALELSASELLDLVDQPLTEKRGGAS
ncbi:helix-turn-helix transcriptional regulator [Deinococcus sp.]|uniref:helix-turn-helix domain-containing protein n=1 Tax=Deinococcus sp. TaxID=47478 RepID=UPI0025FBB5D9|nr:helix-turn-helix transcriptional regulator [Deinococcus sp.]